MLYSYIDVFIGKNVFADKFQFLKNPLTLIPNCIHYFLNHLSYSGSEWSYPTCDGAPGQIAIVLQD